MYVRLTAAIAAAAAALATSALAEPVVAKLQTPVAASMKPVAGGAVFDCLGPMCAARSPEPDTGTLRSCKELAHQVGAVTSYGAASKPLSAEQVASCNESAKK